MSDAPPVLLVPGAAGQDYLYWNVMARRLRRDGFDVYTATFPRFTLADLRLSAELLASRVDDVRATTGAERLALVCHSMGGLLARWWLRHHDGWSRTAAVVHLGVPHKGTASGLSGLPFRGARQIVPGSPFLHELNDGETPPRVPVTNVWSLTDFIVVPPTNARLDVPGVRNEQVTLAGHWGMLVSGRVYGHVREGLTAAARSPA